MTSAHTTAADCSENMVGSLSTKKLLRAALKSAAWGTGSARDDRTEWLSVRNGGTRAAGPNTQRADWGHLEQSIYHHQQGGRPQEQAGGRTGFLLPNGTLWRVR